MSCSLEPMIAPGRVARLLGVEVETLAAWRRKGYGPRWYRIGGKIGYTESDLRVWLNAQAGQLSDAADKCRNSAAAPVGIG
jgi:DNA-binding transcriptional MerR regulator